jgi:hypothetical protein
MEAQLHADNRASSHVGLLFRWGEEFVYLFLKSKYKGYTCRWVNQLKESGKPYDLVLTRRRPGPGANLQMESSDGRDQDASDEGCYEPEVYVEVKTTTGGPEEASNPFPISLPELLFSREKEEHFQLFRVFRAGTSAAKILAVSDFFRRLTLASQLYCQMPFTAATGNGT